MGNQSSVTGESRRSLLYALVLCSQLDVGCCRRAAASLGTPKTPCYLQIVGRLCLKAGARRGSSGVALWQCQGEMRAGGGDTVSPNSRGHLKDAGVPSFAHSPCSRTACVGRGELCLRPRFGLGGRRRPCWRLQPVCGKEPAGWEKNRRFPGAGRRNTPHCAIGREQLLEGVRMWAPAPASPPPVLPSVGDTSPALGGRLCVIVGADGFEASLAIAAATWHHWGGWSGAVVLPVLLEHGSPRTRVLHQDLLSAGLWGWTDHSKEADRRVGTTTLFTGTPKPAAALQASCSPLSARKAAGRCRAGPAPS